MITKDELQDIYDALVIIHEIADRSPERLRDEGICVLTPQYMRTKQAYPALCLSKSWLTKQFLDMGLDRVYPVEAQHARPMDGSERTYWCGYQYLTRSTWCGPYSTTRMILLKNLICRARNQLNSYRGLEV